MYDNRNTLKGILLLRWQVAESSFYATGVDGILAPDKVQRRSGLVRKGPCLQALPYADACACADAGADAGADAVADAVAVAVARGDVSA